VGASTNGDATELDAVLTQDRPTSEAVALEVREVSVSFGGIRAVDDVSFTLAKGEVLGIIGPNGAGKTTLFDLISGITKTDAGRVRLGSDDISSLSANRRAWRGLGRSFQDSRLFPSLTVEDTLMVALERWLDVRDPLDAAFRLPAFVDSEAAARHRVDELIELMGIEAFRTKFVGELSTGSRRVVDLACVLAHEPSVVLLDEPSSGIAQREAEALGPLLLRIRDALEASLVVIEHDMGLVTDVSDRLLALDQGRVLASGTPDEVLSHRGVVDSYLGGDLAVIGRSGPRPEPSTEVPA
jgi:ABC-type branched-subunit amino acid transport system ATPase component